MIFGTALPLWLQRALRLEELVAWIVPVDNLADTLPLYDHQSPGRKTMNSLLDACEFVLADQGEPQSAYWLASIMMETRLWRASEADVQAALVKDIQQRGKASPFVMASGDEFALRAWIKEAEPGIR